MSRPGLFFEEFPPTSTDSWIDAIETEFKGGVSVDDLTWHPEPDLDVRPFYRREDVRTETHPQIRRRTRWLICDRIHLSPGMDLAPEVEVMKESGADAVELILPTTTGDEQIDLSALEGLNTPIFLFGEYASLELHIDSLIGCVSLPSVSLLYDPISRLFTDPSFEFSPILAATAKRLSTRNSDGTRVRLGSIDERPLARAGAGCIASSACLLSGLACWIRFLGGWGINASCVASELTFVVSVGTSLLPEIARLRALRHLAPQVVSAFGTRESDSIPVEIHAVTSETALPTYDIHTNLIRTTTQAFAAVLGGCDSLSIHPFDAVRGAEGSEQARRCARNIQLILRHESRLGDVEDPIAGSYYIEALTNQMIELIWSRFLKIENAGGLVEAIGQGIPQQWISEDRDRIRSETESGVRKIVGVTAYADARDRTRTIVSTIETGAFRAFDGIELFRSEVNSRLDTGETVPSVHLVGAGTPSEQSRGLTFASNFLACGGFPVTEAAPALDPDAVVQEALRANPSIIMVCGSPDAWKSKLEQFSENYRSAGGSAALLYATYGRLNNSDMESVTDRIVHPGSHLLETLESMLHIGSEDDERSAEVVL